MTSAAISTADLIEQVASHKALSIDMAREHLDVFLRYAMPLMEPGTDVVWGRYLDVMCEHVEAAYRGDIMRLLFHIGPRNLKSKLKVAAIAWIMIRDPHSQHILAAHDMRLSIRDALAVRDLVTHEDVRRDFGLTWGIKLDQNNKGYWATTEGGHVVATSTGSDPIGFGAHYIWPDDILSEKRSWSEAYRAEAIDMLSKRLPSRLNDKRTGKVIAMWQRLHPEDPSKWCAEQGYDIVSLPLVYEPEHHPDGTSLGDYEWRTRAGDLLHPERWDAATVAQVRKEFGPRAFNAQYQQRPQSTGDCILRASWFQPGACPVQYNDGEAMAGIYLDPKAGSSSKTSSFAVALLIIRYRGRYYVADMERERCGYTGTKRMLRRMRERYTEAPIVYENAADGRSFSTDEAFAEEFENCRAVEVTGGNTLQRLDLISGHVQSGEVTVHATFAGESPDSSHDHFMAETCNLPGAANDDIGDAFSMGMRDLRSRARNVAPPIMPDRKKRQRPAISSRGMR